jgi:hypothetical protein
MIPDRSPDTIRSEAHPVADEIDKANVIRLERHGRTWRALVGPDRASGVQETGDTPRLALVNLAARCEALGWVWDETWRDR